MGLFDMFNKTKEEKQAIRADNKAKKSAHRAELQRKQELNDLQKAFREGRISLAELTERTGEVNRSSFISQQLPAQREVVQQSVQAKSKQPAYFLNDRDIKMLSDACMLAVRKCQNEETLNHLAQIGGKLRDRADFTKLDVSVIAVCLQAYSDELSGQMKANPYTPLVPKLREEKEFLSLLADKLAEYMKTIKE